MDFEHPAAAGLPPYLATAFEGINIRRRCISRPNEHQSILLEHLGLQLTRQLETIEM